MKHEIFSIFDSAARAYLPPFVLPEETMAIRVFSDCVNSGDHQFGAHPGDYTLFNLGVWDNSKGVIMPLLACKKVCNGLELVVVPGSGKQGSLLLVEDDEHETA